MRVALKGLLWRMLDTPLATSSVRTLPTIKDHTDEKKRYKWTKSQDKRIYDKATMVRN